MPFTSPTREYRFILDHVAGFSTVAATDRFAEATPDLVDAILAEAGKLCDEVLAMTSLGMPSDIALSKRFEYSVRRRLQRQRGIVGSVAQDRRDCWSDDSWWYFPEARRGPSQE